MAKKIAAKFQKIGLVTKSNIIDTPEKMAFFRGVVSTLQESKKTIFFDQHAADAYQLKKTSTKNRATVSAESGYSTDELFAICDLIIVMGGDGTILKTASHAASQNSRTRATVGPLILGVNLGNLGFLSESSPATFTEDLRTLFAGKFSIDSRTVMEVSLERTGENPKHFCVLNDAVLNQGIYARLVSLEVEINVPHQPSLRVATYRSDGLIISTPTGSTGHSLAAGGPIVHPSLSAFILSPICPSSLSVRPIVIPNDQEISIKLNSKPGGIQEVGLTLDGQRTIPLQQGDIIKIQASKEKLHLVRLEGNKNYYEILRTKLHWGGHV